MKEGIRAESKPKVEEWRGDKSIKRLRCSLEATTHMREMFKLEHEETAQGVPMVLTIPIVPREMFQSMGIRHEDAAHFGALCSAKQMSRYYLDRLNAEDYFRDLCRYCTVSLGYAFDHKPEIAPYGGIPKLAAVISMHNDDPEQKIFELYAREFNVPVYMIDMSFYPSRYPKPYAWWAEMRETDAEVESCRVNQLAEELQGMIRFLETITGRHYSETKLRECEDIVNRTQSWYWKATDLAAGTVPCPITATDTFVQVAANWFAGSEWLANHAKKYYDEVKSLVDNGEAACPNEKVRLFWGMYIGLWYSLGFYNAFEEKYGAIFLPTPYMPAEGQNIRRDLGDPLRRIASRLVQGYLDRLPTTAVRWKLHQATKYKANGGIFLVAESCKLHYASTLFTTEAFERAGLPALIINADMVDARDWDDTKMKSLVSSFIEVILA